MKKHIIILSFLFGIFAAALSSCSTTQTFTVQGIPGTVISKNNKQMAVIDQTGQAQLTLDRKNGYEHFFLAQTPGSNIQVPFALDYMNHNRSTTLNLCKSIGALGLSTELMGLIFVLVGASSDEESMLKIGGLVVAGGALIGLPAALYAANRENELDYNYDYLQQSTNNDLIR